MRWFLLLLAILGATPAFADVDYPVYACEGPFLDMLSPGGLSPQEVSEQFPDLPAPASLEFYILQDGDTAAWTDMTRDELRAMCLGRVDMANKPWDGLWIATVEPFDPENCTAPPPVQRMIGTFPRALAFEEIFRPTDILNTDAITWKIDRYPEDLIWSSYAGSREGVTEYRSLAVTFVDVTPRSIEIDLYVETLEQCYSNYTVILQLDGY